MHAKPHEKRKDQNYWPGVRCLWGSDTFSFHQRATRCAVTETYPGPFLLSFLFWLTLYPKTAFIMLLMRVVWNDRSWHERPSCQHRNRQIRLADLPNLPSIRVPPDVLYLDAPYIFSTLLAQSPPGKDHRVCGQLGAGDGKPSGWDDYLERHLS